MQESPFASWSPTKSQQVVSPARQPTVNVPPTSCRILEFGEQDIETTFYTVLWDQHLVQWIVKARFSALAAFSCRLQTYCGITRLPAHTKSCQCWLITAPHDLCFSDISKIFMDEQDGLTSSLHYIEWSSILRSPHLKQGYNVRLKTIGSWTIVKISIVCGLQGSLLRQ